LTYLIDTNVVSEVRKKERCDPNVARWYASIDDAEIYLSVLVLGEIRKGIELARPRDPRKATVLERWLAAVKRAFEGRILLVDEEVIDEWGRMNAPHPRSVVDSLQAATAKVHGLTFVTRNTAHVEGTGAIIFNPFESAA